MYTTIVVGAYKSETAQRAAAEARDLARTFGAHLHLVSAYSKDRDPVDGRDSPARLDAQRTLDAMAPAAATIPCTTHVLPGDPARAILQVAREVGADLIVVGNKGMRGKGRFLGSVPNDVAHEAACAVLIIPSS